MSFTQFFLPSERILITKSRTGWIMDVPPLQEVGLLTFYNLIFGEMNNQIRDAVISMIDREREGEDIDQILIKNDLAIYVDVGQDSMKYYEKRL
ncbi:hypothetical protein CRYUN_Cryun36dG0091000 [Craigia yunnanensis]